METLEGSVLSEDRPLETQVTPEVSPDAEPTKVGEAEDPQGTPEQGEAETERPKRLGGWQRKIAKLEQERDVWRDEALRTRPVPKAESQELELPPVPDLQTWLNEGKDPDKFDAAQQKALKERETKLKQAWEQQREDRQRQEHQKSAQEAFNSKVAELPELEEMKSAAREAKVPARLEDFLLRECAIHKNGTEVLKALLLDEDQLSELVEMDRLSDGTGIKATVVAVSRALRIASDKPAGKALPAQSRAPKPPTPVTKASPTDNSLRDDLDMDEWLKRRYKQLEPRSR